MFQKLLRVLITKKQELVIRKVLARVYLSWIGCPSVEAVLRTRSKLRKGEYIPFDHILVLRCQKLLLRSKYLKYSDIVEEDLEKLVKKGVLEEMITECGFKPGGENAYRFKKEWQKTQKMSLEPEIFWSN